MRQEPIDRTSLDPRRSSRRRCLPCPARHVLEPTLPFGVDGSSGIVAALFFNPHAESLVFGHVGDRDSGVTMPFDVVQKSAETVLPLVGMGVPCPAGQVLELALARDVECAF